MVFGNSQLLNLVKYAKVLIFYRLIRWKVYFISRWACKLLVLVKYGVDLSWSTSHRQSSKAKERGQVPLIIENSQEIKTWTLYSQYCELVLIGGEEERWKGKRWRGILRTGQRGGGRNVSKACGKRGSPLLYNIRSTTTRHHCSSIPSFQMSHCTAFSHSEPSSA